MALSLPRPPAPVIRCCESVEALKTIKTRDFYPCLSKVNFREPLAMSNANNQDRGLTPILSRIFRSWLREGPSDHYEVTPIFRVTCNDFIEIARVLFRHNVDLVAQKQKQKRD